MELGARLSKTDIYGFVVLFSKRLDSLFGYLKSQIMPLDFYPSL
jgi:hypothetical protein